VFQFVLRLVSHQPQTKGDPPKMSGPAKRLSIRAGKALAQNTFDTALLPQDAIRLDAYCELNGYPIRIKPYRWLPSRDHDWFVTLDHVEKPPQLPIQWAADVYETEIGGISDVIKEDPFIAKLYENMIRDGWSGKAAREQLEYILRRDHNREHRKWLDNKRNTRAWVEAEFKRDYDKAETRRVSVGTVHGDRYGGM
jgi:hypothetical protein